MVVHWRKLLFLLPSGSTGKSFIEEMTRLINSWTLRSQQDAIAMKALMVLPILLLQKTSFTSKSKDNVESLTSGKMGKTKLSKKDNSKTMQRIKAQIGKPLSLHGLHGRRKSKQRVKTFTKFK